jgi:predicted signal transduction protein with EAL and GGDEF domain
LEETVNYELEPFAEIAPSAGFLPTEILPPNKKNHLLNITMTMVLLSEEPKKEDFNKEHICELKIHNPDRRLSITKTLINLVDQVSTELEKTNKELQHLSNTDSLTELYNHRYFLETLEHEINRAKRYKKKLSIAILDLDDFKFVNDTFGHSTGDRVLSEVAGKIKSSCRETDIVSRYGGDEIVIIFTETV